MYKAGPIEENLPHIARAVIIIPVIILMLGAYVKVANMRSSTDKIEPTPTPEQVATEPAQKRVSIDLKGPFVCSYASKDSKITSYIKDENVRVTSINKKTTTYIVLRDDCLSIWKKNLYTGERACGMKPYISLVNNMSRFGLVKSDSLINMLGSIGGGTGTDKSIDATKLTAALESCVKKEISDLKVFDIPPNIIFKKKDVKELMQSQTNDKSTKKTNYPSTSDLQNLQQAPINK